MQNIMGGGGGGGVLKINKVTHCNVKWKLKVMANYEIVEFIAIFKQL